MARVPQDVLFLVGNFDNFGDKLFMGRFPYCNFLTIDMLLNKMNKIPTTSRNQTV